jgi:carboxypeptidase C (cathepsin A)
VAVCSFAEILIIGNPILPMFNLYDVRQPCEEFIKCYPDNGLSYLMNALEFRKFIGGKVGPIWEECNMAAHLFLLSDYQVMYGHYLKDLLNSGDLNVLIYNGDKDYTFNWKGGEAWT